MKSTKIAGITIAAVFIIHTAALASDVKYVNNKDEKTDFGIFSLFKKQKEDTKLENAPIPGEKKPAKKDNENYGGKAIEENQDNANNPENNDLGDKDNPSKETTVIYDAEEFTAQDGVLTVEKNTPKNGSLNSTVPDTEAVVFAIETPPSKGEVTITDTATGDFVYTPNEDATGTDLFEFSATSETHGTKTASIMVTITAATGGNPSPSPSESPEPTQTPTYTFRYEDMYNHWGEYSAIKIAEDNILRGFKIGQKYFFYPETELTRGDFILYLVSSLGLDVTEYSEIPSPFADAEDTPAWMNLQAKAAFDAGIIKGSKEGDNLYLNAHEKLTRLEAIAMLNNTIKPDAVVVGEVDFSDMYLVPQWGVGYIQNMSEYGLLKGYDDGTVRPFAKITRAMAAEMLNQTLMYKNENPEIITELKAEMDKKMAY